jgi:hypothetical protein|tara:strand:- start:902 stop:1033 length:132 start_codon:yes stop_codon:yes gene_type:complete
MLSTAQARPPSLFRRVFMPCALLLLLAALAAQLSALVLAAVLQ